MKMIKKLSAAFVAFAMVMMTVVPAFAEETATSKTASINVGENMSGRTLVAYQIFKATDVTPAGSNGTTATIKNVSWGENVTHSTFISELNKIEGIKLEDNATSNEVANAIQSISADSSKAIQVAKAALAAKTGTGITLQKGNNSVTLGYYLIVDETSSVGAGQAINPAILLVNGDVTVKKKNQDVTVDKSVKNETDQSFQDATNSSIGKPVTFRYVSQVINAEALAQYETYKYSFEDTLSEGVDVNVKSETDTSVDFKAYLVTADNATDIPATLTASEKVKDITVKFSSTAVLNNKFTISCNNLKILTDIPDEVAGKFIVIEYTGKLNEKAMIGGTGNSNTVTLEYSNNPNDSGSGTPSTGKTDPSTAIVFTFGYDGTKVDISTPTDVLAGAKFVISRMNGNTKEYAMFDNGLATEDESDDTTHESAVRKIKDWKSITDFEKSSEAYKKSLNLKDGESLTEEEETLVNEFKNFVITSNSEGKFGANGLGNGTYMLTEIIQPEGYVRPSQDFNFTITSNVSNTNGTGKVEELKIDDVTVKDPTTGLVPGTIKNTSTIELPETGGMGTTMLYVIGGVLLVGSAILLITKKRMSNEG
ncbi:SpaA isopeptide-forming pilin-related protein [Dubosiella newyorkensis]|uniref:SpaA isopeptide-forming pilin-related protein n=1 Tax=Dubosiella newyorkensis TaxID=1862672 RepID=UPI00272B05B8|nr:SpaA isopeptide-forming pilin-related protein [Dubosiella newyorkensis]